MVFSSLTFLILFLPAVLLLYFLGRDYRYRNAVLLVFSLLFYAWGEPKWIFVMLLTVGVNYLSGILMEKAHRRIWKTVWMLAGVTLGLGFLVYFKYAGFLLDSFTGLLGLTHSFTAPVLPIGISFYTFQVLTYTIDVYRGKVPVQRNFAGLLLYVSFFPQLIAGPIVNYKDIEHSLKERRISLDDFYQGFLRFLIGFAKKILLANTCGEITQKLGVNGEFSVLGAWLLAVAYTFQIYFDFSGYSDMAIGMGRMFGFHFLENFSYPYMAKSVTEFWRKWHISLGTFFREYVYIPLGGNRVSAAKRIRNLLVVWALTGIWHGASWNFLVWGLYYGVLLIIEKQWLLTVKEKLPAFLNRSVTLLLVVIGWVLFYHTSLAAGLHQLGVMFGIGATGLTDAAAVYYLKRYLGFLAVAALACVPWKQIRWDELLCNTGAMASSGQEPRFAVKVAAVAKPVAVTLLFLLALGMLVGQSYNPFLYFRF